MTKRAKAAYYSNLFDEVKTAAAYWRLLKKASGTTKTNNQARQLKENNGTLTVDDIEKANLFFFIFFYFFFNYLHYIH